MISDIARTKLFCGEKFPQSVFPERHTSATWVRFSAWRNANRICSSLNFDFFMAKHPSYRGAMLPEISTFARVIFQGEG